MTPPARMRFSKWFAPRLGTSLAATAWLLSACTQQLIPNTDLADTEENRSLVEFCELYRHAVERRDIDKLLSLAHPDYYEDGGKFYRTILHIG